jgi:predicted secreted protein
MNAVRMMGARARIARGLVILASAAAITLAGCGGGSSSKNGKGDTTTVSPAPVYTEQDTTITVDRGKHFAIKLDSNPSTGFTWAVVAINPGDQLHSFAPVYSAPKKARPGEGGTQTFAFFAVTPGTTELTLGYERVGSAPAKTATFQVTVR